MSIDKLMGDTIKEKDDLGRSILRPGSVTEYFQVFQETIEPAELYTIHTQRNLGSSFILGHPVWGYMGSDAAFVVTGSQPYLGDSRDATFITKAVSSPFNRFREYFAGSRFNETGSTTAAGWGYGSLVFGGGITSLSSGLDFRGQGGVEIQDNVLLTPGSITIEFWLNPGSNIFDLNEGVVSKFDDMGVNQRSYAVVRRAPITFAGSMRWSTSTNGIDPVNLDVPPGPLNTWTHWAFDLDAGSKHIYKNGTLVGSVYGSFSIFDSTVPLRIGIGSKGTSYPGSVMGIVDELRISDIVRYTESGFTPSTTAHTSDANTLLLYHLDDITKTAGGSTITDSSSNSFTGSVIDGNVHLIAGSVGTEIGAVTAQSKEIHLGSQNLSSAKLTVVGSTNLDFSLASNGSQFESVALGSTYAFTNTGSDLRWKGEGSNAILTKVQVEYNI